MSGALLVSGTAAACAGLVGMAGLLAVPWLRRRPVGQIFAAIVLLTVVALLAAVVGATAVMMLIAGLDFGAVLAACVAAGAVSFGFAALLARQVVAGSAALSEAVRELGRRGRYTAPPEPATAELAVLARELEGTSRALEASRERERALEASRRELVAWISHDLRSPLAGLRAMAEALEDGLAADPARYHRRIRAETDRLARMVDDLFELARINAGLLRATVAQVSLTDLVDEALASAAAVAEAHRVALSGRAEPLPAPVAGDAASISRMIVNLITNAIQHTPHEGAVVVEVGPRDGQAVVAVTDSCGGIPEPDLDRVFDVAWRGSRARTPGGEGGAGLGLAIVRGIAEAHRGTVAVRNVDQGCRFEVRLPLTPLTPLTSPDAT